MGGLLGGGSDSPTIMPAPATPGKTDAQVQAEAAAERRRRAMAAGRESTILTSGLGVGDFTGGAKTLLGA